MYRRNTEIDKNIKLLLEKTEELWPTGKGHHHQLHSSSNEQYDFTLYIMYADFTFNIGIKEDDLNDISWLERLNFIPGTITW